MPMNREKIRQQLQNFNFKQLFADSNWAVVNTRPQPLPGTPWLYTQIAEMSRVGIYEVTPLSGHTPLPDAKTRAALHSHIEALHARENLVIFTDAAQPAERTQSLWYWVKYDGQKKAPREHLYLKGQPGDLFLSKLDNLFIDMDELRDDGTISLLATIGKLSASMDVERVTKKFYTEFSALRVQFIDLIEGIEREADRFWYASVLLNRLMFVYFLQKRGFIQKNTRYLDDKLAESQARGSDLFYTDFLTALFFQGFALPPEKRTPEARRLLGEIRYLNGGLFLPHQLETKYPDIRIPDRAFENVLGLFGRYSWHLDDTPGAQDNEINPDVLGYIFEKYINQKAFGAYYTRSEITQYLCERTINAVIVDKLNAVSERQYGDIGDVLLKLDADVCRKLLAILPTLSILDPACGSGAFLVAAMKTLLDVYAAVYGKIRFLSDTNLSAHLRDIDQHHPSINYYIRKRIITDNLYGVDIMEEATEIARLRLFLFLVSSAQTVEQLEPLPNIDFNIMCGNSLIGLLKVDETRFNAAGQADLFAGANAARYRRALDEKNRLIDLYRKTSSLTDDLSSLRGQIEAHKRDAYDTLDGILLGDFQTLNIRYEQAQADGKAKKRPLVLADIRALTPFHWGYEFDRIVGERGGFDVIITNPPWEVFKPNSKEFFADYSDVISKNNMRIEDFDVEQERLLQNTEIQAAWLDYLSRFPHVSSFYRSAAQFANQISIVNGKKAGTDINLYKVFTEQTHNLLRKGGRCGIVIPSGIYTDLGAKQLREVLFTQSQIDSLFGLSNERFLFEGVDHRFKIALLVFSKGGSTQKFEAAFRINPREAVAPTQLDTFLHSESQHLQISVPLIRKTSPDSLSIAEVKSEMDVTISEKMLKFPLLGDAVPGKWAVKFGAEFHMTNDSHLFRTEPAPGRLPLYEGKMIWQFAASYAEPRYWVDEKAGRQAVIGARGMDKGQKLDYEYYRLAYRSVASSTNERTFISSILPRNVFCGHSLNVAVLEDASDGLVVLSFLDSYIFDYIIRQKVTTNLTMFFVYQTPFPRLTAGDPYFAPLVERAARLICTTPEFDDLAREVGLTPNPSPKGEGSRYGVTEVGERARLRAEIDGMVAHLYGLTEAEFTHILGTFPLVSEAVKAATLQAYRDVGAGKIKA